MLITTTNVHYMDAVAHLLKKLGWFEEPELVVKDMMDRPVFSKNTRLCIYKVVIGPLWTTYYDIKKEFIGNIDSIKTVDYEKIENKILEMDKKK